MSIKYGEIWFNTDKEAHETIRRMSEICMSRGYVTIADMYDIAGVTFTDDKYSEYGWNTVDGAFVKGRNDNGIIDGYTISMPLSPRPVYKFPKKSVDNVNHPDHYMSSTGLETIDVIEAFTSDLTGMDAVCTANVIKYICRWKHKNGIEDLEKAQWYLNRLIEDNKSIERKSN